MNLGHSRCNDILNRHFIKYHRVYVRHILSRIHSYLATFRRFTFFPFQLCYIKNGILCTGVAGGLALYIIPQNNCAQWRRTRVSVVYMTPQ